MEYKTKDVSYGAVSPGTIGVAQKISIGYESGSVRETSKLVFLTKNNVIACSHNQY